MDSIASHTQALSQKKQQQQGMQNRRGRRSSSKTQKLRQPPSSQPQQRPPWGNHKRSTSKVNDNTMVSDGEDDPSIKDCEHITQFSLYRLDFPQLVVRKEEDSIVDLFNLCSGQHVLKECKLLPSCCFQRLEEDAPPIQSFQIVQVMSLGMRLKDIVGYSRLPGTVFLNN